MRHACGDYCYIVQGTSEIWKFDIIYEGYELFHVQMVSNNVGNLDYSKDTIPSEGI
jgi:hypothetical protein